MAQGLSTHVISIIKWVQTSRLLIKISLCALCGGLCKITPVVLHGVVSPSGHPTRGRILLQSSHTEMNPPPVIIHGVVSPEEGGRALRGPRP